MTTLRFRDTESKLVISRQQPRWIHRVLRKSRVFVKRIDDMRGSKEAGNQGKRKVWRENDTYGTYTNSEHLSAQIAHRVDAAESGPVQRQRLELVEFARVRVPAPNVSRSFLHQLGITRVDKSKAYRRREAREYQLQRSLGDHCNESERRGSTVSQPSNDVVRARETENGSFEISRFDVSENVRDERIAH